MGEIRYFYERFDAKEIIYREFIGDMTVDEIIASFNYLISENKISAQCIGIITDTTHSNLKFSLLEFSKIPLFLLRTKKIRRLKLAVIVNTPKKTIFPVLAGKKVPFLKICPFSEKESAFAWILK